MEISEESISVKVHIPQEIIDNILTKLPLKSLVRFESVCKAWYSSISNPNFRKRDRHSVLSIQKSPMGTVYYTIREQTMPFLEAFPVFWDYRKSAKKSWDDFEDQHSRPYVSNSCNGMVLICVGTSFYLFNPLTKYSVKVLTLNYLDKRNVLDTMRDGGDVCYKLKIGLFYDETISDYKAVVLISHGLIRHKILVEASLKEKRWNHLNNTFMNHDEIKVGPVVNGQLYWLVNQKINRFDPVLKVFEELPTFQPLPNHSRHGFRIVGIGFMEGCLCVSRTIENNTIEILAMKEFGVSESWTPIFSFAISGKFYNNIYDFNPLLLTRIGELFVSTYDKIWVYKLSKKSFEEHLVLKGLSTWLVSFVQNTHTPTGYYWNQTEHEDFGNTEEFERIEKFWKEVDSGLSETRIRSGFKNPDISSVAECS